MIDRVDMNNAIAEVSRGKVIGSSENLRRIGETQDFLFDLDDTIAIYDANFIKKCLYGTIKDHTYSLPDKEASSHAAQLHGSMHDGSKQKAILGSVIDASSIPSFWQGFTDYLHQNVDHQNVHFDARLIKFINFAIRNALGVGVISNSTEMAGNRVLSIMHDETGIDLRDSSVFLGQSTNRKPKKEALNIYEDATNHKVEPEYTAYIGNSVSDLVFAKNIGMTPVLIDYSDTSNDIGQSPQGRSLIEDSIVINNFASIKNHIELLRPNYRRQISLSVDRSLSNGESLVNRESITLEPTDDTVYRIAHDAASEVMKHVPSIWQDFHDRFSNNGNAFSFVNLPSYQHLVNEASGAYLLPNLDDVSDDRIRQYYTSNRLRHEGVHRTNRGSVYYRQYIDGIKDDFNAQVSMIQNEVRASLDVLREPLLLSDQDHLGVLGIEDNLRGNLLSIYLSSINILRDGTYNGDTAELVRLSKTLHIMYRNAVSLQYSHMLGLEHSRDKLVDRIEKSEDALVQYKDYCASNQLPAKMKNPEVDNSLLIAARANYLCQQYPNTDTLVGLTSGGVELAEVSKLLYEKNHNKEVKVIDYPISVHNGLTMWSKDKEANASQTGIDKLTGIEQVENQHVVVCEDNSNSGQTLDRVIDRIKSYGATSAHFAVIEIDPTRVILHHVQQKAGAKHNIGQAAERTRPIANYFHPDFVGTIGVVKILPQDNSFSKIIAIDTANKYVAE